MTSARWLHGLNFHCQWEKEVCVCLTVDKACTVREMTKLWGRGREAGRQRRRKWKWQARVSDGERKQTSEDESARGRERSVSASPSRRKEQGRGVGESTPCSEWMSSFPPPRAHPSIPLFTGGYASAAQRWSWDSLSKTEAENPPRFWEIIRSTCKSPLSRCGRGHGWGITGGSASTWRRVWKLWDIFIFLHGGGECLVAPWDAPPVWFCWRGCAPSFRGTVATSRGQWSLGLWRRERRRWVWGDLNSGFPPLLW